MVTNGAGSSPGASGRLDPVEPVRTCVGCRRRDSRSALLRVVAEVRSDGARVVPDPARDRPGRGASLHLDLQCLAAALKRRSFGRALRVEGPVDASQVEDHVKDHVDGHLRHPGDRPGARQQNESGSTSDEHPMSAQR